MTHPAFTNVCTICHSGRYRVSWGGAGYALLCALCDWGVTLNRPANEKPTWWYRVIGGENT